MLVWISVLIALGWVALRVRRYIDDTYRCYHCGHWLSQHMVGHYLDSSFCYAETYDTQGRKERCSCKTPQRRIS